MPKEGLNVTIYFFSAKLFGEDFGLLSVTVLLMGKVVLYGFVCFHGRQSFQAREVPLSTCVVLVMGCGFDWLVGWLVG